MEAPVTSEKTTPRKSASLFKWISNGLFVTVIAFVLYLRLPSILENYEMEGKTLPEVKLQTIDGQINQFPTQTSWPKLVIFWATWCGPCTHELERIQTAINEKEIKASSVLAINLRESVQKVSTAVKKRGLTMEQLIDPSGELAKKLGVKFTPTVFLVNKNLKIDWASTGPSPTLLFRLRGL